MKKLSPAKTAFLIIGGVLTLAFIAVSVKVFVDRPQDLGPELEYISKERTGCPLPLPLGYILLCSTGPGEEYYFATDLDEEELRGYFKKANASNPPITGTSANYSYLLIGFEPNFTNNTFYIQYFNNPDYILDEIGVKTTKKNVVSLSSDAYKIAKMSLQ